MKLLVHKYAPSYIILMSEHLSVIRKLSKILNLGKEKMHVAKKDSIQVLWLSFRRPDCCFKLSTKNIDEFYLLKIVYAFIIFMKIS